MSGALARCGVCGRWIAIAPEFGSYVFLYHSGGAKFRRCAGTGTQVREAATIRARETYR